MPFPTIATPSLAFERPASFIGVFLKPSGGKYQTMGAIRNGVMNIASYAMQDSMKKNKAYAVKFTAKCSMMQGSLTEIELMDSICDGTNDFLFQLPDAAAIPGASAVTEGWVKVTSAQVGVKAKLVGDGTPENDREIELEFQGSFISSALAAVVKASIDDDEFEATGDAGTFHAIGTYTAAKDGGKPTNSHIVPCGLASVTLAYTGGAAQTLGAVNNVKMSMAFEGEEDSIKRFRATRVMLDLAYDWKQSDAANLINLANMVSNEIDIVMTYIDGLIITLTNQVGIQTDYENSGDFDKDKVVRFTHSGAILKTSLDGVVS